MKTLKKVPVQLIELNDDEFVPEDLEFGKLYYSKKYSCIPHLCVCGCGQKVSIPIGKDQWSVNNNNGKVSISPSILHRIGCRTHYVIENGIANII